MLPIARVRSFDTEVANFLRVVFERADIRDGIDSYSKVWAIMKVCILSSVDLRGHFDPDVELTRKWSLYRRIPQVLGVCSGHARPVRKNIISSRQSSVDHHVDRFCFVCRVGVLQRFARIACCAST